MANRTTSLWPVIRTHGAHNLAQQAFLAGILVVLLTRGRLRAGTC
jgi:membrane protease YdiL (CAAX protease family)